MNTRTETPTLFRADILRDAVVASLAKLAPRTQLRNPVMFAVYVGSIFTTLLWVRSLSDGSSESGAFILGIALWLWATVLFANFAEAIAEGHGKAQAASMRKSRTQVTARRLIDRDMQQTADVPATELRVGDLVLVRAGDVIPA